VSGVREGAQRGRTGVAAAPEAAERVVLLRRELGVLHVAQVVLCAPGLESGRRRRWRRRRWRAHLALPLVRVDAREVVRGQLEREREQDVERVEYRGVQRAREALDLGEVLLDGGRVVVLKVAVELCAARGVGQDRAVCGSRAGGRSDALGML
jgi:hypothetical protein